MLYKQVFLWCVFPPEHLEYVEYVMCGVHLNVKQENRLLRSQIVYYQLEVTLSNKYMQESWQVMEAF